MASGKPIPLACRIVESSQGVKDDIPIIFVHGLGGCKDHWKDIPHKVAEATHKRVYVIDARNHGDSPWSEELNFDLNVVDFIHFIEQIAAEKVSIVGHSMGGITVMKTALKMPSKIDKMVVEDIGIVIPEDIYDALKLSFTLYEEALLHIPPCSTLLEAKKFIDDFVYEHFPEKQKSLVSEEENSYLEFIKQNSDGSFDFRPNFKVLIKAMENKHTRYSEYKGVYDGPACFIYGGKSRYPVFEDAETIKKFFPKAQFVGIESATHDVHFEKPILFTNALLKFLKE